MLRNLTLAVAAQGKVEETQRLNSVCLELLDELKEVSQEYNFHLGYMRSMTVVLEEWAPKDRV